MYLYNNVPVSCMPTTPVRGKVRNAWDNRGFDSVLPSNSPLLGSVSYQISTKDPAIPRNHVGNLIHHILSTVKVNVCTIHHIMGINIKSTNCIGAGIP